MKTGIIVFLLVYLASCSDEPDCVVDRQFIEKSKAGETRYTELSKHMTCYDENGKRY